MPVSCPITDDILIECGDDYPIAGIGKIYIAPVRQLDMASVVFSTTTHDITALPLLTAGEFAVVEAKVSTKDLATENTKDGGGNIWTITANAIITNLATDKSFILQQYGKQKLVVVVELYTKAASGNRKALVLGLDNNMKQDAGVSFSFNPGTEAEQGGVNGYNCVIAGVQGESPRFFAGALLTTGTATVNLG